MSENSGSNIVQTFLCVPKAKSKAVLPILLEARSVMRRVALASLPSAVIFNDSSLTYYEGKG